MRGEVKPKTELHRKMVELIPNRLILGPSLSKRTYTVKTMMMDFGVNCFVNLRKKTATSHWYMPNNRLLSDLVEYAPRDNIKCISMYIPSDVPLKDKQMLAFVNRLAQMMKKDSELKVYIHDTDGTHVAASVALPLMYFLKTTAEKDTFDPIQAMRRKGKHHLVSSRNRDYVDQITRICELDKRSIHKHLLKRNVMQITAPPPPEKKKRKKIEVGAALHVYLTDKQRANRDDLFTFKKQ